VQKLKGGLSRFPIFLHNPSPPYFFDRILSVPKALAVAAGAVLLLAGRRRVIYNLNEITLRETKKMAQQLTRERASEIWHSYNSDEALWRHAQAVEGAMRRFAARYGEDVEKWGVVGLLHDVDYEKWPQEHCKKARELLAAEGVDEELIHAVMSHGWGICCDVEPVSLMEKVLFTVDELTGLINAVAIMRPSKSVMDLELKSVKKKYKDKRFAAGVDRSTIEKGCGLLGLPLDEVITETVAGMRECADAIGLGMHPAE